MVVEVVVDGFEVILEVVTVEVLLVVTSSVFVIFGTKVEDFMVNGCVGSPCVDVTDGIFVVNEEVRGGMNVLVVKVACF